jgi:AraC-like DNA-binding protein
MELLEETRESIAGIASRLGFSDQSHFDRRFRRKFGCTPSQHRAGLAQSR